MDYALYASLYDFVDDKCRMSRVCENASLSVNPHKCDNILFESMGVVDILLKK